MTKTNKNVWKWSVSNFILNVIIPFKKYHISFVSKKHVLLIFIWKLRNIQMIVAIIDVWWVGGVGCHSILVVELLQTILKVILPSYQILKWIIKNSTWVQKCIARKSVELRIFYVYFINFSSEAMQYKVTLTHENWK